MREKLKFRRFKNTESGQAVVEFALIIPILILLITLPVDYFRYINTKMILCSAASESIGNLTYDSVKNHTIANDISAVLSVTYQDRLDVGNVMIENISTVDKGKIDYTYYVYSSAKHDPYNFGSQFEERPSNYKCTQINMQLTYEIEPITFWGELYLGGNKVKVETPIYSRSVYSGGYTE